jgi:ATP-dependent RNA helicase DeaD
LSLVEPKPDKQIRLRAFSLAPIEGYDMENFKSLNLPESLMHTLDHLGFTKPTPVQAAAIPLALKGRDILGSAQTGTGKTAAFGIPLVVKMTNNPDETAVIITPTRELAAQVHQAIQSFLGKSSKILTALLIGGEPMPKQLNHLRRNPQVIVGTPGRINDHLSRNSLRLDRTSFLVLDETDRMLDMGFAGQIEKIVKHMPKSRQTLLFSATLPHNIVSLSRSYMINPERVAIGSVTDPAKNIKQEVVHLTQAEKYPRLQDELIKRNGSIIVFVKSKYNADKMAKRLRTEGHEADAIHGDLRHNKRERVIKSFHLKKIRILVATDIAARGLDIPHIEHGINFDLPQSPEDYIHRIGRTARAGAEGEALCFISSADDEKWYAISKLMNPNTDVPRPARKKPAGKSGGPAKNKTKPFSFKQHSRGGGGKPRSEEGGNGNARSGKPGGRRPRRAA